MNVKDLVNRVSSTLDDKYNDAQIKEIMDATFNEIKQSASEGAEVHIREFGMFNVVSTGKRKYRNPKTGESVITEPRKYFKFKASRKFNSDLSE